MLDQQYKVVNPNLKPGESIVDFVVVEAEDGSYSLARTVETCDGTWGKMIDIGPCPKLNINAFPGLYIRPHGVSLLKPLPVQKEPLNWDALREARYDIASRKLDTLG